MGVENGVSEQRKGWNKRTNERTNERVLVVEYTYIHTFCCHHHHHHRNYHHPYSYTYYYYLKKGISKQPAGMKKQENTTLTVRRSRRSGVWRGKESSALKCGRQCCNKRALATYFITHHTTHTCLGLSFFQASAHSSTSLHSNYIVESGVGERSFEYKNSASVRKSIASQPWGIQQQY